MFKYCVVIDIVIIILTQSERNTTGHSRVIIIILSGVNRLYVLYRKDFYTVRKRCLHYILSGVTQSSLISSYLMPRGPSTPESTLNRKPNRNVCASLVLGDVSQSTYYVSSGPVCNGRQSAIMTNVSYNNIRYILTKYILYVT